MKRLGLIALGVVTLTLVLIQLPLFRIEIPIPSSQIVSNSGFSYLFTSAGYDGTLFYFPSDGLTADDASTSSLLEDGKPLGPGHEPHENIRKIGRGGFSHWYGQLVFSTSDNTDPSVNGRSYKVTGTLRLAAPWSMWAVLGLAVSSAALLICGGAHFYSRRDIIAKFKRAVSLQAVLPFAKLAGVAALFAICWRPYLTRATTDTWLTISSQEMGAFWSNGQPFLSITCGVMLMVTILGLCIVPFIRDGKIRLPLALLIVVAFLADAIVLNVAGQNLSLDMVDTLWRERNVDADTFVGYLGVIARFGAVALVIFALFAWPPNWSVGRKSAIVPVAALVVPFAIIYATHGATTASSPGVSVAGSACFR